MAEDKLYRVALREALSEEMERDDSVYLIGEDIGKFGGAYRVTDGLLDKFGAERVVDAPIAEEAIVGTAIGSAMLGLRPVVEMMTINFSLIAYDQILNRPDPEMAVVIKCCLILLAFALVFFSIGWWRSREME